MEKCIVQEKDELFNHVLYKTSFESSKIFAVLNSSNFNDDSTLGVLTKLPTRPCSKFIFFQPEDWHISSMKNAKD